MPSIPILLLVFSQLASALTWPGSMRKAVDGAVRVSEGDVAASAQHPAVTVDIDAELAALHDGSYSKLTCIHSLTGVVSNQNQP